MSKTQRLDDDKVVLISDAHSMGTHSPTV